MVVEEDPGLEVGDLIFGKVQGTPHWPAQIAKLAEGFVERKNWYFVHWFGTAQHGYVRKKDCLPFLEHKNHFMNKPVKSAKWALALTEIMGKQADQDRKAGKRPTRVTYQPSTSKVKSPSAQAGTASPRGSAEKQRAGRGKNSRGAGGETGKREPRIKFPEAVGPAVKRAEPFKRNSKRSLQAASDAFAELAFSEDTEQVIKTDDKVSEQVAEKGDERASETPDTGTAGPASSSTSRNPSPDNTTRPNKRARTEPAEAPASSASAVAPARPRRTVPTPTTKTETTTAGRRWDQGVDKEDAQMDAPAEEEMQDAKSMEKSEPSEMIAAVADLEPGTELEDVDQGKNLDAKGSEDEAEEAPSTAAAEERQQEGAVQEEEVAVAEAQVEAARVAAAAASSGYDEKVSGSSSGTGQATKEGEKATEETQAVELDPPSRGEATPMVSEPANSEPSSQGWEESSIVSEEGGGRRPRRAIKRKQVWDPSEAGPQHVRGGSAHDPSGEEAADVAPPKPPAVAPAVAAPPRRGGPQARAVAARQVARRKLVKAVRRAGPRPGPGAGAGAEEDAEHERDAKLQKGVKIENKSKEEWVGVEELHPLPPVDAVPSIDQLLKLKDDTNSALAQFEQRREAHVSARGRAKKLREAAERALQAADEAEGKLSTLASDERKSAMRLGSLVRELSAQPVTLELLQSTGIGKAVKKLSKHKDPVLSTVSAAYRKLMDCWLKMASEEARRLASEKDTAEALHPASAPRSGAPLPQLCEPGLQTQSHSQHAGGRARAAGAKTTEAHSKKRNAFERAEEELQREEREIAQEEAAEAREARANGMHAAPSPAPSSAAAKGPMPLAYFPQTHGFPPHHFPGYPAVSPVMMMMDHPQMAIHPGDFSPPEGAPTDPASEARRERMRAMEAQLAGTRTTSGELETAMCRGVPVLRRPAAPVPMPLAVGRSCMRHLEAQLGGTHATTSAGNANHSSAGLAPPLMPAQSQVHSSPPALPQRHATIPRNEFASEGIAASNSVAPLLPAPLRVPGQEVKLAEVPRAEVKAGEAPSSPREQLGEQKSVEPSNRTAMQANTNGDQQSESNLCAPSVSAAGSSPQASPSLGPVAASTPTVEVVAFGVTTTGVTTTGCRDRDISIKVLKAELCKNCEENAACVAARAIEAALLAQFAEEDGRPGKTYKMHLKKIYTSLKTDRELNGGQLISQIVAGTLSPAKLIEA